MGFPSHVTAIFTEREGGVSTGPYASLNLASHVGDNPPDVERNRRTVAERMGAPVVFMNPEHGTHVERIVDAPSGDVLPPVADILVTTRPGIALAALAADCVPMLAYDDATGAIAAIHVGRRGLAAGVVDAAVEALAALGPGGGATGNVHFALGPSVCGRCYEVPQAMHDEVAAVHPAAVSFTLAGAPSLDLPAAIVARLAVLGHHDVSVDRRCTVEDASLFSYRRDGVTGRQAGVILAALP